MFLLTWTGINAIQKSLPNLKSMIQSHMRSKWDLKRISSSDVQSVSGQDTLILVVRKQLSGIKSSQSNPVRAQKWELAAKTSGIAGPCREVSKVSQELQGILKALPSSASKEQVRRPRRSEREWVRESFGVFKKEMSASVPPGTASAALPSPLPLAAELSSAPSNGEPEDGALGQSTSGAK